MILGTVYPTLSHIQVLHTWTHIGLHSHFAFCFYAVYMQRRLLFTRQFPLLTLRVSI
jgi:hypothetical protein